MCLGSHTAAHELYHASDASQDALLGIVGVVNHPPGDLSLTSHEPRDPSSLEATPYQGMQPPTESDLSVTTEPSWPTAVGVCGIVYAALGLIGGCLTFGMAFGSQYLAQFVANQPGAGMTQAQQAQLDVSADYAWISMILGPLFFATAAWLLIASIGLTRRRARAPKQTILACCLRIALGVAQAVGAAFVVVESMDAMRAAPDYDPSMDAAVIASGVFGVGFGIVWTLLYPAFALFWLNRPSIKGDVRAWRAESSETEDRWIGASHEER